jgi:hypothetical protein
MMYALRKSDLNAFPCRSENVCRIDEGSTNRYLKEDRIIEEVLREIEPYYNSSVQSLRTEDIDHRTVFAISGFIAYVQTCSPTGMRIFAEPMRKTLETIAEVADAKGALPIASSELGGKSLRQLLADGTIKFEVDPKYPQALGISTMMGRLSNIGNSLWEILLNEHSTSPFFTSDYPIAIEPDEYVPRVLHWIVPLAPNIAVRIIPDLRLTKSKDDLKFSKFSYKVHRLSHAEVKGLNRRIVQCAENTVFYQREDKWVPDFVAKNRYYRIETITEKRPMADGTLLLPTQRIVPYHYSQ